MRKRQGYASKIAILAAASIAGFSALPASAIVYIWNRPDSTASGSWNTPTDWLNGLAPLQDPLPASQTQDIVFSANASAYVPNSFGNNTIDSLTFADTGGTKSLTMSPLSSVANPSLTLLGTVVANNNSYNASIGNYKDSSGGPITPIDLNGNTITIADNVNNSGVSGTHYLYIDDPIAGSGAIVKTGQGMLILNKVSSTWTGDANGVTLYLNQGSIRTGGASGDSSPYQFGTGIVDNESDNDVSITASSVSNEGGGSTRAFNNEFKLGGAGQMTWGGSYGFDFTASSSWVLTSQKLMAFTYDSEMDGIISSANGSGFTKSGGGVLTLTNTNTYSGPTIANSAIVLNGATASSANSDLIVNSSGSMEFDGASASGTTRFASVTLNGGTLTVNGSSSGNTSDVVAGPLVLGSHQSVIALNPSSGGNATLNLNSETRTGGTLLIQSSAIGGASGPGNSSLIFQTAPSLVGGGGSLNSTTTSILPWAVGDSTAGRTGEDFVTYNNTNGVQLLTTYKDQSTFADGNSTLDNVKLSGPVTISSAATANSLILTTGGSVEGAGTLTINSGAILATDNTGIGDVTPGTLNFGSAEGIITVNNGMTLTVGSNIAGTGGLTKSGTGTLILSASTNSYSGTTTLTDGVLQFAAAASLGSGPIQFNGGTLQWAGGNSADVSNKIGSLTSTAVIDTNGNNVTFASPISPAAGNITAGLHKTGGDGTLTLNAVNTYSGDTTVDAGVIQLNNANAIQNSTLTVNVDNGVAFAGGIGTFNLGGLAGANAMNLQDVNGAPVNLQVGSNNANTTYSGDISGSGGIIKVGNGTLTLNTTDSNSYSGGTTLAAGTLSFTDDTLGSGPIRFTGNATLQWGVRTDAVTPVTQDVSGQIQPIPAGVTASFDVQGNTVTFGSGLSGGGAINKLNTGVLILANSNTYTGGTTISGGTLQIGNGGTSGSIAGDVADNGSIAFNRSDDVSFAGKITGSGSVVNAAGSGTLTLNNSANNIGGYLEPDAPVTVAANMTVGQISGANTLNITAGRLTMAPNSLVSNIADLNISGSAQLDLGNNSLLITDTSQMDSIVALLTSAYDKGKWDGPGIMTSQSTSPATIGYNEITLGSGTDAVSSILIKYTLPGDTNLDGIVNSADFLAMSPIGTTGATWAMGDFNYDGIINADDAALFMLGAAVGSINQPPVPEPAAIALATLVLPLLIRRKRKLI